MLLLGLSITPLIVDVVIMRVKLLRRLLALPLFGLMIAAGLWAGNRWYKLVHEDKGNVISEETGELEKRPDWFAFAMAVVVGLGVFMFMRELFTHQMARAYTEMLETPSEDD